MELIYTENQIFLVLVFILWLCFTLEYFKYRKTDNETILALTQFGFMFPFVIVLSTFAFNYSFGFILVFIIPVLSIGILADAFYKR